MKPTFSFGRIGGVPVGAHWSALVGVAVLGALLESTVLPGLAPGATPVGYGLAGGVGAVALVVSLLTHELAHAMVARRNGLEVRRITLWLLGGVSEFGTQPSRAAVELRVALAGPGVSIALGVALACTGWILSTAGVPALVTATLFWLATVNAVLAVFNLLPGSPLDGGRVLHGLIWLRSGDRRRATRAATGAGQLVGAVLAALGLLMTLNGRWDGLWLVVVGWFLAGSAVGERAYAEIAEELEGLTAADAMTRNPHVAPGWWTVQAFADGLGTTRRRDPAVPRHRVFPVVDLQGRATGMVRLEDLIRVPPADRRNLAVRQVAQPLVADQVVAVGELLVRVAGRPLPVNAPLLLVEDDGRLVGVIGATDLATTAALHALRAAPSTAPDFTSAPPRVSRAP
jgi:Zn-dependent protease/CBS domain-containing protein